MSKRETHLRRAAAAHAKVLEYKAKASAETERRNAIMRQAWDEGATLTDLAEAVGITKQAVSVALGKPSGVRGGYQRRGQRAGA